MSGGRWRYEDWKIDALDMTKILIALKLAFHEVDYAESGDSNPVEAKETIYAIIKSLGDRLFGV
jgi:hypothetical protein